MQQMRTARFHTDVDDDGRVEPVAKPRFHRLKQVYIPADTRETGISRTEAAILTPIFGSYRRRRHNDSVRDTQRRQAEFRLRSIDDRFWDVYPYAERSADGVRFTEAVANALACPATIVLRVFEPVLTELVQLKLEHVLDGRARTRRLSLDELSALEWALAVGDASAAWNHWAYARESERRVEGFDYRPVKVWSTRPRPLSEAAQSNESSTLLLVSLDGDLSSRDDSDIQSGDFPGERPLAALVAELTATLERDEGTVVGAIVSRAVIGASDGLARVVKKMREPWKTADALSSGAADLLSELAAAGLVGVSVVGESIALVPGGPGESSEPGKPANN